MNFWLATDTSRHATAWVKRFDPVCWTVDFPRPMMASVVTTGPHALRVDAVFYRKDDLAGLIWASEDRVDHPLLGLATDRDYRRCVLSFRWRSAGLMALDAVNGPTLTIEGRDASGVARSWYVRLWNYGSGTPDDARVRIDFGALDGGFLLPGEADPVWAGDIDRMFISLVSPGYNGTDASLGAPVEGWVELSEIVCEGSGSVIARGDAFVPPHGLNIATGYDDAYNVTPARLLRSIEALGYRGTINHYVGMSHYLRLEPGGTYASLSGGAINVAAAAWHRSFAAEARARGYGLILSLSYELFDAHCWNDWKQRDHTGAPARTGYTPPSTLLSPAHTGAMAYLAAVARAFVQIAVDAGHAPQFQIGEPWWWTNTGGKLCLYDDAARAALGGNPIVISDVRGALTAAQKALLDAAGAVLAASTAALFAAVRGDHPTCTRLLLLFLPTVLDPPDAARANVPLGWARPAFDVLQIEDYDWVTAGDTGASTRGVAAVETRLGYPVAQQQYLTGFARDAADWPAIMAAERAAAARGVATRFVWALPQVLRDGLLVFETGEAEVEAFDDVSFPLALGKGATVAPTFSTQVVTSASGFEQRNADWAQGRMRYDAGPGLRSEADIATLIAFFRARRGAAKGFRFRDPFDFSVVGALLGSGDGARTRFQLVKRYGDGADAEVRRITRPVALSVVVRVDGIVRASGWRVAAGGIVEFDVAPAPGAAVTADFTFDVPVRFAEDRLEVDAARWLAGDVASVGLVEVRE